MAGMLGMCLLTKCQLNIIKYKVFLYIENKNNKLHTIYSTLRYIVSLEDKLPKMICDSCCKKLEGIHKFATMAVKIQDKFNKLVTDSINNINNNEPKHSENKGLLHTYLTKGIKEKEEITEMEVKVDPMLILECAFDDDDISDDAVSDTENENLPSNENLADIENNYEEATENVHKPFSYRISEFALQNHMWNHLPQNKHVLLFNFNNSNNCKWEENSEDKQCENRSSSSTASEAETSENLTTENSEGNLRFTCPICGKIISTKGNLKVHLETHRPKGKYGCDICGRIFKTQCNLYRHKEYHEGVQFPCAVCGRVYPTNSTLRAHSITHSDLRPHKCPLCVKTFKRNQDLKFHINQHTGARPYQCPYCPKAFASSGNCFSHRKRMHPLEVERDREKAAKIMR